MKKIAIITLLLSSIFITTACNDADDRREQQEREAQKKRLNGETVDTADYLVTETSFYQDISEGDPVEIFKIGSDLAVDNGGTSPLVKLDKEVFANEIWTYHYNDGKGAPAGTIKIMAEDGTIYGPWQTERFNTTYWIARPNQNIPAGSYTIIDSDPATWSQNQETKGKGMTWMNGIYTQ